MTALDWVLIAVLAAWLIFAVVYLARRKGSGCCNCCTGDCGSCRSSCRSKRKKDK